MKKSFLIISILVLLNCFAQENFAGYNSSNRIGVLQSSYFPSISAFQTNKLDIHLGGVSVNLSNNKLSINDFLSEEFETKLWSEDKNVSFRVDSEIIGLGASYKYNKWGFGLLFKSNIKLNVLDINSKLGNAIINNTNNIALISSLLNINENQRINLASWSEIGFNVSRVLIGEEEHFLSLGTTLKLLMPGSYANFGLSNLNARLSSNITQDLLINANGNLNVAYSGNLAGDFNSTSNYTQSIIGKPNGFGLDIGTTYQWKKEDDENKLLISASVRNIGSMTFEDDNKNTNYTLRGDINLNNFGNANSIKDVENQLINDGNLVVVNGNKSIKVNLPTTFNFMATAKIISKFHGSINLQQAISSTNNNDGHL